MKTYKFSKGDAKWLDDQFTLLLNVEDDLDYKDAIMCGQWPSSVEILGRCLDKAKLEQAKKIKNEKANA
jgi:hypothetical protein